MYSQLPIVKKSLDPICSNVPNDAVLIHGKLYTVDAFNHPGGRLFVEMVKGTDATNIFETHHLNYKKAVRSLSKLPIASNTERGNGLTESDKIVYNFDSYREFREKAFGLFCTKESRVMNIVNQSVMIFTVFITCVLHILSLRTNVWSINWIVSCIMCSIFNTICGGYGHNALHRLEYASILLDWNGLSAYEWLHEHVHSHHMYTNTQNDNDALTMAPLLLWIPTRTKDGDLMVSLIPSWGKHLIYSIAEIVVAFKGIFLHRARWKIGDPRVPLWLQLAPFIFILRIVSYMFQRDGIWTCAFTMIMAGYYFAHLAHLTHVYGGDHTPDFLKHQMMNTKDIPSPLFPALIMFLDRQTLHHLLPTICHTRLTKDIRKKLSVNNFMVPFEYRSLYHIQTNVLRGNY